MKILVCCANGAGTSMMMARKVKQACTELGLDIQSIGHTSLSEGKTTASNYDVVFCSQNFAGEFEQAEKRGVKVIGMRNILSVEEAKQKLQEHGLA